MLDPDRGFIVVPDGEDGIRTLGRASTSNDHQPRKG